MDIEEKLAKFRENKKKLEIENHKNTKESFLKSNFIYKYFFHKTNQIEPDLIQIKDKPIKENNLRKRDLVNKKSNSLIINENDQIIEQECSPEEFKLKIIKIILKFLLWAVLYAIFIKLEFGLVYLVCSLLVIIYLNTNVVKKSRISAYSVFNPNVERLPGQITAEKLEKNLIKPF